MDNAGNVRVTSGDTPWVNGDFSCYGTVEVTATGKLVVDGHFDKPGTFLLTNGARVLSKAFDFADFPERWKKTGPDDDGYYSLEFVDTVYAVSFDSQGGSDVASAQADYGGKVTQPTDPTRTGYTFSGWYKEAACENAWDFDADTVTGAVTLCAKWLGYAYEDGALTISDLVFAGCTSLTRVDIPSSVTSIDGYAFTSFPVVITYNGTKAQWDSIEINEYSGLSGKTIQCSDGTIDTP